MGEKFYIAYGSNLNVEQMKERCPHATIVGTAQIQDYELLFKGFPSRSYLTIEKKEGSYVPVGVWKTNEEDEKLLDIYEDYPNLYYKTELTLPVKDIHSGNIQEHTCYVYIMYEDKSFELPSEEYINTCLVGYKDFGFDENILKDVVEQNKILCSNK